MSTLVEDEIQDEETQDEIPMDIAYVIYTIQGEGVLIGTPTLLVRFVGCNKKCAWCDIPQIRPVNPTYNSNKMIEYLEAYAEVDVSFTGGEPMLQPQALAFLISTALYVKKVAGSSSRVVVETNGCISPKVLSEWLSDEELESVFWSVNPKTYSSTEALASTKIQEFLQYPNTQFKFAIDPYDENDIRDLQNMACILPVTANVVVQPVVRLNAHTHESYRGMLSDLMKIVKTLPYHRVRMIPQLQKIIMGMEIESM